MPEIKMMPTTEIKSKVLAPVETYTRENTLIIDDFTITDQGQAEMFDELLGEVQRELKKLETQKTSITGPLNEARTAINKLFNPTIKELESLKKKIKDKILEWQIRNEAALLAAVDDDNFVAMNEIPVSTNTNNTRRQDYWTFRVRNIEEVPRRYLKVDEEAVFAEIAAAPDPQKLLIPGIDVITESKLVMK